MENSQKNQGVDFSEMSFQEVFNHLSGVENLSCLSFEKNVNNKFSKRSDLHAFILLNRLFPDDKRDIVTSAEHDEIYLAIDPTDLLKVASIDQIRELVCCGVLYDSSTDSLTMFV